MLWFHTEMKLSILLSLPLFKRAGRKHDEKRAHGLRQGLQDNSPITIMGKAGSACNQNLAM